jgi:hypothetical protein
LLIPLGEDVDEPIQAEPVEEDPVEEEPVIHDVTGEDTFVNFDETNIDPVALEDGTILSHSCD